MPLIFVGIGLMAGVLAGVFGIGGGVIVVPALVILGKLTQKVATGTSLGALLLPVGMLGAYAQWKAGNVNVQASLLVALGMFAGTWVGSQLSLAVSEATLRRAFAVLLVAVATRLWLTA